MGPEDQCNAAPEFLGRKEAPEAPTRRKVNFLDDEFRLAQDIMRAVEHALFKNPNINTCNVRRLCEMMLEY